MNWKLYEKRDRYLILSYNQEFAWRDRDEAWKISGYLTEDGAFRFQINRSYEDDIAHTRNLVRVLAVKPSVFCGGSDTETIQAILFYCLTLKAQWLLYVPSGLTLTKPTPCPHSAFLGFVSFSEK
jgi:hypothetical protein